jgi:hypothetical protein
MTFIFNYPSTPYYLSTPALIDISRAIVVGPEPSPIYYSISPSSLPYGLTFNTSNGTLGGTTAFSSIAPLATYTVDASYSTAVASTTLTFSIDFIPQFSYPSYPIPSSPFILEQFSSITIYPVYLLSNTIGITYSLLPAPFPTLTDLGLSLNTTNGVISGIPDISSNFNTYFIRANNSNIIYDASLSISVQSLPTVNYSQSIYILTQNIPVSILPLPTQSQSNVTYDISGCDLPIGLSFNTATGEISGTPRILTTFRSYSIIITNVIGSSSTKLILNVIKEFLSPPVEAENVSSNTLITDPVLSMRRKAEILKYRKNSSNITKQQKFALLAKGAGPYAKRAWGTQGDTYTNPNISNLPQVGSTLLCPTGIICSPTSSSNVPGPVMNLCYNPSIPLVGYMQPNRKKTSIGFKWPLQNWQPGDNGFPNGKAGTG